MAEKMQQTQNLMQAPGEVKSAVLLGRSGDFKTQLLKSGCAVQNNQIGRTAQNAFTSQLKKQFKQASSKICLTDDSLF